MRTPDSYPNNGAANPGNLVNHGGHQNDDAAHHDDNNNGNDDGDDGDGDDDGDDVDQEAVRVLKVTPDGLHLLAGLDDGAIQVYGNCELFCDFWGRFVTQFLSNTPPHAATVWGAPKETRSPVLK